MKSRDIEPFDWINRPAGTPDANDIIPFGNGLLDFKTNRLWLRC